jgi:exodeoxyribonuclease VIII
MNGATEPGIYPGMSEAEYRATRGWNWSVIRKFKRSAAHARVEMLAPPEPNEEMTFGHAFHRLVLEPDTFEREFVVVPEDAPRRQGKANMDWWAQFDEANKGRGRLTSKEAATLFSMRDGLLANPRVAELLAQPRALRELVVVWDDPEFNVRCKGKLDLVAPWKGRTVVADLKSERDASDWWFAKDLDTYDWAGQIVWYTDGLQRVAPVQGGERIPYFLVVEKEPPFAAVVYELGQASREVARAQGRELLRRAVQAERDGLWPGYRDGLIELPTYALNRVWSQSEGGAR